MTDIRCRIPDPLEELKERRSLMKRIPGLSVVLLLSVASLPALAASDLADAAMHGNKAAVRTLLQQKVDVNGAQIDGTTALHWAVRADDIETTELLLHAGAKVTAA